MQINDLYQTGVLWYFKTLANGKNKHSARYYYYIEKDRVR